MYKIKTFKKHNKKHFAIVDKDNKNVETFSDYTKAKNRCNKMNLIASGEIKVYYMGV